MKEVNKWKERIKWNEGEGYITAAYGGSGDGSLTFTSNTNKGIDREQIVKVKTYDNKLSVSVSVKQIGLREVFTCTDGDFILADGGTFNVLK